MNSFSFFALTRCAPGVIGGKFLERGRVRKPGQELFKSELSEYFTAQDLYVGATLCLNSKDFQLLDADEYTLNYMEQHAEEVGRELKEECLTMIIHGFILKLYVNKVCSRFSMVYHCRLFSFVSPNTCLTSACLSV